MGKKRELKGKRNTDIHTRWSEGKEKSIKIERQEGKKRDKFGIKGRKRNGQTERQENEGNGRDTAREGERKRR